MKLLLESRGSNYLPNTQVSHGSTSKLNSDRVAVRSITLFALFYAKILHAKKFTRGVSRSQRADKMDRKQTPRARLKGRC